MTMHDTWRDICNGCESDGQLPHTCSTHTSTDRQWTCGHCGAPVGRQQRDDADDADMPFPACEECTDLAVMGAWCLACNDRTTLPGCPPAPRHVYKPGTIQLEDPSPIRQAEWVRRLAENAREITR